MKKNSWDRIVQIYQEKYNIPPYIVDYIAVQDILKLCCTGLSNETISNTLDIDWLYVKNTLITFLDFEGWAIDLDINCWQIYQVSLGNYFSYTDKIKSIIEYDENLYNKAYNLCRKFSGILKEIDAYLK